MSGSTDNDIAGGRVSEVIDGLRRRLGGVTGQLVSPRSDDAAGATSDRSAHAGQDASVDRIVDAPGAMPVRNWRWE